MSEASLSEKEERMKLKLDTPERREIVYPIYVGVKHIERESRKINEDVYVETLLAIKRVVRTEASRRGVNEEKILADIEAVTGYDATICCGEETYEVRYIADFLLEVAKHSNKRIIQ